MTSQPRLGFGCASLGSRISARDGLAALTRAYDAGVRWFDVAPSYGDGQAEELLGRFLHGRRGEVTICTKVGILPPAPSLPKRLLRPLIRGALSVAPGLRGAIKRHRPPAVKPPLTAAMVGASVDHSLRRLGVERIDVLALHAASPVEVARDDILEALAKVVAAGKAARISIASGAASVQAGLAASPIYRVAQVANNPFDPELAQVTAALPEGRPIETVTHTVFGASGMIDRVEQMVASNPVLRTNMNQAGYTGTPREIALAYLPDFAFATNRDGVVLMSMFSKRHLEANLTRHAVPRDRAAIARIADLLTAAKT